MQIDLKIVCVLLRRLADWRNGLPSWPFGLNPSVPVDLLAPINSVLENINKATIKRPKNLTPET